MELKENMVLLDQAPATKKEAIRLAGELLVKEGCVDERYIDSMIKRNEDVSTYMGNFIAIPHGTDEGKRFIKKTGPTSSFCLSKTMSQAAQEGLKFSYVT